MQRFAMALPADRWHEVQHQRKWNAGSMVQLLRAGSGSMQRAQGCDAAWGRLHLANRDPDEVYSGGRPPGRNLQ